MTRHANNHLVLKALKDQKRNNSKENKQHECMSFTPATRLPIVTGASDYIKCRTCKRSIIEVLGLSYLQKMRYNLRVGQCLIPAGCFRGEDEDSAIAVTDAVQELSQQDDRYNTDGEESDIRIWRHVKQCEGEKILVYSPDTDVSNVGIGIYNEIGKEVIVQVNVATKETR